MLIGFKEGSLSPDTIMNPVNMNTVQFVAKNRVERCERMKERCERMKGDISFMKERK